jgi:hypothetical protein
MDFTLKRSKPEADGVFGVLLDSSGKQIAVTLEHAFLMLDGVYEPKVAAGVYTCERHAPNRLPYTTFELQNVPDFLDKPVTGILIHIGNYNADSDGCLMLGSERNGDMIMDSKVTFNNFMALTSSIDSFTLTVIDN